MAFIEERQIVDCTPKGVPQTIFVTMLGNFLTCIRRQVRTGWWFIQSWLRRNRCRCQVVDLDRFRLGIMRIQESYTSRRRDGKPYSHQCFYTKEFGRRRRRRIMIIVAIVAGGFCRDRPCQRPLGMFGGSRRRCCNSSRNSCTGKGQHFSRYVRSRTW